MRTQTRRGSRWSSDDRGESGADASLRDVVVMSEIRFLCESVVEALVRLPGIRDCAIASTLPQAIVAVQARSPGILLFDAAFPGGAATAAQLCAAFPALGVIALGMFETEDRVLAWAEAGVRGYVPNTASIADLGTMILQVSRGEQACSSRVAGSLWRRVATAPRAAPATPQATLTRREFEVVRLVGAGLSNKDIARRLGISVGTAKTHVHNVLDKLGLARRADVMAQTQSARLLQDPPPASIPPLSPR